MSDMDRETAIISEEEDLKQEETPKSKKSIAFDETPAEAVVGQVFLRFQLKISLHADGKRFTYSCSQ